MALTGFLNKFKNISVLLIGDVMLDRYIWGRVKRISPEAPVPVVDVVNDTFMLGGAANVARNIASLSGRSTVIGVTGDDRAGEIINSLLMESGITPALVIDSRPTTVKTRVIAHSQQVVRFDKEDRAHLGKKTMQAVLDLISREVPRHDAIIISDYKKGVISAELMKHVLKCARGKFVAVDPKVGHFHLYKKTSLITPNISEAENGSGVEITDEQSLLKAGRTLIRKLGTRAVLLTRGEEGMTLFEKDGHTHIPTMARQVYDVTGAGDTVIAVLTLAKAAGAGLADSAIIANHAAGIVVGEVGTSVTTIQKLRNSIKSHKVV